MAGFHFERDLPHQTAAVEAVLYALRDIACDKPPQAFQNGVMCFADCLSQLQQNIASIRQQNGIKVVQPVALNVSNLIFDIAMETGTGKTYAYAKTIFELNKQLGLNKFIVAVPRVAIKAGAVSFLTSAAAREHFKLDYAGRELKVYEVMSSKAGKAKRSRMPQAVLEFCRADNGKEIHVLVINSGMINSPTLQAAVDTALFDQFFTPMEALPPLARVDY